MPLGSYHVTRTSGAELAHEPKLFEAVLASISKRVSLLSEAWSSVDKTSIVAGIVQRIEEPKVACHSLSGASHGYEC